MNKLNMFRLEGMMGLDEDDLRVGLVWSDIGHCLILPSKVGEIEMKIYGEIRTRKKIIFT